jgi:GT2 family glycosyltransferase
LIGNLAILMTCHNRVATTVECLRRLFIAVARLDGWSCKVFLVDDGSTDGTGGRVRAEFPDVHVIDGDGTLYWAKGMRKAWETAAERDWDAYLWLNDDTALKDDAFVQLMAANDGESIVVGELRNEAGKTVYGLRDGGLFTGNCVLVPRKVYEQLGMICGEYAHAWADSDYAQRAMHAGVKIVSGGVVGSAEGHPNRPSLKGLRFGERMCLLRDPKGWNLHDLWLYRRRNWGLCVALVSCAHLALHVMWGER